MRLLSPDEMQCLLPAETHAFRGPVPTQIVSSEEYFPTPQTAAQREVAVLAHFQHGTGSVPGSWIRRERPSGHGRRAAAQRVGAGPAHTQT